MCVGPLRGVRAGEHQPGGGAGGGVLSGTPPTSHSVGRSIACVEFLRAISATNVSRFDFFQFARSFASRSRAARRTDAGKIPSIRTIGRLHARFEPTDSVFSLSNFAGTSSRAHPDPSPYIAGRGHVTPLGQHRPTGPQGRLRPYRPAPAPPPHHWGWNWRRRRQPRP